MGLKSYNNVGSVLIHRDLIRRAFCRGLSIYGIDKTRAKGYNDHQAQLTPLQQGFNIF